MNSKVCKTCSIEKPFSDFNKSKKYTDGYTNKCKSCKNLQTNETRTKLKEGRVLEYENKKDEYVKTCTKCDNSKKLSDFYFENNKLLSSSRCKICFKEKVNEYRAKNNEVIKAKKREYSKKKWLNNEWTEEQLVKRQEQTRQWRINNPEHVKNYNKKYKTENKGLCKEIANKRRAKMEYAQLDIVKRSDVITIYHNCPEGYHVDHIVPLSHPDVCGLHTPWNLQYLPSKLNLYKNNKFDGTIENESWRSAYEEKS